MASKTKAMIEREIEAAVGVGPVVSYDRWAHEFSDASRRHGVSIAYGTETHDAWRSGMSPDQYA